MLVLRVSKYPGGTLLMVQRGHFVMLKFPYENAYVCELAINPPSTLLSKMTPA